MMWKEKYRIGVDLIDEQHKELFDRVSRFIQTVQHEGDWSTKLEMVKETLAFMKDYVVTHFHDEEEFQREIDYPDYLKHKEVHEHFKEEVGEYAKRFDEQAYNQQLVQEFAGKLMAWLIHHVGSMDQKMGAYVRGEKGEEA